MSELALIEMFAVNCPKTRNEEFGQLLEALTEKYCQVGLGWFNQLSIYLLPRL